MIRLAELAEGLAGAWKLAKGDPMGLRHFDFSLDGFWRSFGLIVPLALPVIPLILAQRRIYLAEKAIDAQSFSETLFLVIQLGEMVVVWFAIPLVLAAIAQPIGLSKRFVAYIVARNWASLLGIAPFALASVLFVLGLIPTRAFSLLALLSLAFNLYYGFMVARIAAAAPVGVAVGLVVLDYLVTVLVTTVLERFAGF